MIYIIESGNHFKVGYAKDWSVRRCDYNTHNPNYKLLMLLEGNVDTEKYIQKSIDKYLFKIKRLSGSTEWYLKFKGWKEIVVKYYDYFTGLSRNKQDNATSELLDENRLIKIHDNYYMDKPLNVLIALRLLKYEDEYGLYKYFGHKYLSIYCALILVPKQSCWSYKCLQKHLNRFNITYDSKKILEFKKQFPSDFEGLNIFKEYNSYINSRTYHIKNYKDFYEDIHQITDRLPQETKGVLIDYYLDNNF